MTDHALDRNLEEQCINTLRFLAVDAIQKANSGHPGMPLGAAAIAHVLWHDFLRYDPKQPDWFGRDRFVLSAGHASGLIYALLHCSGVGLSIDELKQFRQWGSLTPGHPERGLTTGVETTAGPLGAGFATGVGMALAAKLLVARFGDAGEELFGQRIFGIVSDGDLMEGISHEAASMAGHWGLDNLVYFYDSNEITIEGAVDLAMSDDTVKRFRAMGWYVDEIDGLDTDQIRAAAARACAERGRPSLIVCHTHIGYGSPKQDSSSCHGSPLGPDNVIETKKALGWPEDAQFHVPDTVRAAWDAWGERNAAVRAAWEADLAAWRNAGSDEARQWDALNAKDLPDDLLEQLIEAAGTDAKATRVLSGRVLEQAAKLVPSLIGGSADLAPSNKTFLPGEEPISAGDGMKGRNIHFGIREHAMGAVANGMAIHGPWRPYCATFLVFTDYMRPSMRLAAMMGLPVTYVMTHDSFHVGEDGPTHQPIEHVWSLRLMPRLHVFRPADAVETAVAWHSAIASEKTPYVLALSRQGLPTLERPDGFDPRDVKRGGYVLSPEAGDRPDLLLVATGSEVGLAVETQAALGDAGLDARVVSMPCLEAFDAQEAAYRDAVLPAGVPAVAFEAGVTQPWRGVLGRETLLIGIDDFGASAPATVLCEKFGFVADQVVEKIKAWRER